MNLSLRSLVLTLALLATPATVIAQSRDHQAVDQLMQTVMRGFTTGNGEMVLGVLRRDAVVVGFSPSSNKLVAVSAEEWAKGFTGAPPVDESQRRRGYQILDVTDTGAVVKVTLDYPTWDGVDYLALSKINGEWKIISKSWSGTRKVAAP